MSWMYVPNEDVFLLYTKSLCIWMPQTKSTRSANLLFASLLFCRLWNAHYTWTKDEWKQNNKSLKLITRLRRKRREKELLVIIPVWIIVVTVCFSGYHFPFLTSQSGKTYFLGLAWKDKCMYSQTSIKCICRFVDYLFICFCNIPQYYVENSNIIKNARYHPFTKASVGKTIYV